jgi:uncharacterized protein with PIN domain
MDSRTPAELRFLVDHMLGRLVTWLRLLGCDTLYTGAMEDAQIARLAQQQGRIVLTRDRELARRRNILSILVDSEHVDEQLAQVVRQCHLSTAAASPRCAVCNGQLADMPREQAEGQVPPYVYQTQQRFLTCGTCGRIYWQGTHWEGMKRRLAAVTDLAEGA